MISHLTENSSLLRLTAPLRVRIPVSTVAASPQTPFRLGLPESDVCARPGKMVLARRRLVRELKRDDRARVARLVLG